MTQKEISNLDEAAYYYLHGADFISVRERKVQENKINKRRIPYVWLITMGNIVSRDIHNWQQDEAQVPIRRYMTVRDKLKRRIKEHLRI